MKSTRHTKLRYEAGIDMDEFVVFYDFGQANQEFLVSRGSEETNLLVSDAKDDCEDQDEDEWEDISDDDNDGNMNVDEHSGDETDDEGDNDDLYKSYEQDVAAMGLDVTPLGELVFPDGRIIGHRAFRRYYKQRAPRRADNRDSVVAARHAAGDRLYQGHIVNLNDANHNNSNALVARQAGIKPSLLAGGVGKGILVANSASKGSFTQVSIYRYRAALRKQRRGDAKGDRLNARSNMNINRMDKKHNRLMNGVSVAHAAR